MDFSESVKFTNENPLTYIATMDGDQPRQRVSTFTPPRRDGHIYPGNSCMYVSVKCMAFPAGMKDYAGSDRRAVRPGSTVGPPRVRPV